MTKGGLQAVLRSLASEYAKERIRFNAVAPGIVDTPLVSGTEEGRRELAQLRPLSPADIASGVAFALAQPDHVDIDELVISPTEQAL